MHRKLLCRLLGIALLICFWLSACKGVPQSQERDHFPGGSQFYSFGVSQSKENFANVEKAQGWYALYPKRRSWFSIRPEVGPDSINMLQRYYPLSVRWQLKDGRQLIVENINVREIMREYFKAHDIKLPWQREGRPMDGKGDLAPSLVYEVKDDIVVLKWHIRTNHTPVSERFTPAGAGNRWKITREEFVVTSIKGTPTTGIDFKKSYEIVK